jgi:hypothetical protein
VKVGAEIGLEVSVGEEDGEYVLSSHSPTSLHGASPKSSTKAQGIHYKLVASSSYLALENLAIDTNLIADYVSSRCAPKMDNCECR